jgi:DnaJ-class molecular chaperone
MLYKETIPTIIVCPTCKGTGDKKVGNEREGHNHDTELCPDCDGKGRIKRIKTIEYKKI